MPRMQVYLPDDLYHEVKARHLPASELLQTAVRVAIRKQDLEAKTDDYLADLIEDVGIPTPEERAQAQAIVRALSAVDDRKVG